MLELRQDRMDVLFISLGGAAAAAGQRMAHRSTLGGKKDGLVRGLGHGLDDIHAVVGYGLLAGERGPAAVGDVDGRHGEVSGEALDCRRARTSGIVVEDEDVLPWLWEERVGRVICVVVFNDRVAERGGCRNARVV